jgi:protein-S-isoprenylcysteine O-methyltransferase Ste14
MIESVLITLFPALFLSVLIGSGLMFKRRSIDMDGKAPINKLLFTSSKFAIVLLWVVIVISAWGVQMSFFSIPDVLKKIALVLWIIGFVLLFTGRFGLGSSFRIGSPKEQTGLKTDGLFRISRNPMYVGVYTTLLAVVIYTLNPLVLVVTAYIVAVHHQIILAEEAHLREAFGEEYAEYCRRVRRYL